jgi:hypothetical protein
MIKGWNLPDFILQVETVGRLSIIDSILRPYENGPVIANLPPYLPFGKL